MIVSRDCIWHRVADEYCHGTLLSLYLFSVVLYDAMNFSKLSMICFLLDIIE